MRRQHASEAGPKQHSVVHLDDDPAHQTTPLSLRALNGNCTSTLIPNGSSGSLTYLVVRCSQRTSHGIASQAGFFADEPPCDVLEDRFVRRACYGPWPRLQKMPATFPISNKIGHDQTRGERACDSCGEIGK